MAITRRTFGRIIAAPALAAALIAAGSGSLSAQPSGSVTIWVGSWWEPQVPIMQEMWKAEHPRDHARRPAAAHQRLSGQVHHGGARRRAPGHRRPRLHLGLDGCGSRTAAEPGRRRRRAQRGGHFSGHLGGKPLPRRAICDSRPRRPGSLVLQQDRLRQSRRPLPDAGLGSRRPGRDLQGAHHPGRAIRHRRSRRRQRSVERADAVLPDPLVFRRRFPHARQQRSGHQHAGKREGDHLLVGLLPEIRRLARRHAELLHHARPVPALPGEQARPHRQLVEHFRRAPAKCRR